MNMENSKTNERHNFFLNLSQKLDLRSSKHAVYSKKNIRKHKNNKYKIITPTWSDEFQLPDNSMCQIFMVILNISLKSTKH